MFPTFISILDIQSWWEVPSIAHFCSLFRTAFNLLDFDIEDLEEALLTDGTEETSWLQELIVRLLSGCLPNNEISTFNYQMFLRRLFRQKCQEYDLYNPFNTDIDFQLLPLRTKVDILHALCDFRLDADDVLEQLKNLEADSLRVEPLGSDDNESAYWYFYGTRLYREDFKNKNKKGKSVWQVICFTEADWFQLSKKFKKSVSKAEKQLYHTLSENFLPELPRLFHEKERLARKRLLENLPRRTSSRLKKQGSQADDEQKRKELEELERKKNEKKREEAEEQRKKYELQNRRREAYERRAKLRDQSEDSQSEKSVGRYEMAGAKTRERQAKTRQRKSSEGSVSSRDFGFRATANSVRSSSRTNTIGDLKKQSLTGASTTVGRQTNNSLASATGQIVIQPVSNPHRKKLKTSQVFRQTDEDLQTGMYKILEYVKNHDDAWPFVDPVDEEYAPNYYSVIRKPMDLQRMEERLDAGHYKTYSKFKADFQLIVDNCRLYNGAENEYTEMVDSLLQVFERATDRFLDQISSSDEEIAVEFPETDADGGKINLKRKKNQTPIVIGKRKPTLAAQTDKKRERSSSTESIPKKNSSPEPEEPENKKTTKKYVKTNKKKITKGLKVTKSAKTEKKEEKKTGKVMKKKDMHSDSLGRNVLSSSDHSLDQCSSSPPPSWPPSSPEPLVDTKKKQEQTTNFDDEDMQNNKWKDLFKDEAKIEKTKEPSKSPPGHKDKHNKLRETIEKLKAKSELSKFKEKDMDLEKVKENRDSGKVSLKKTNINKSTTKLKLKNKNDKEKELDLEDGNNTRDSVQSENKSKNKTPSNNKAIEALTLATEQTLKDINKWLDDTSPFPDFSSASNSPHYTSVDDYENITNKLEQESKKTEKTTVRKDALNTKDTKKRPFQRDPTKFFKRREIQRTIDRLQPGKSKGNLLSNIPNANKPDELFPLGPLSKIKESKNSLIVKTDDNAPKLSLGSVLDSFGKHKFVDDQKLDEEVKTEVKGEEKIFSFVSSLDDKKKEVKNEEKPEVKSDNLSDKKGCSPGKATPNLSAWFKAFGAPKVQPNHKKPEPKSESKIETEKEENKEQKGKEESRKVISVPDPLVSEPCGAIHTVAPRQRKISTGSSMSERSSFSQDMDSPRVGIEERLGAYPAPYPSPLHKSPSGASPVMASPRPDVSPKAASYPTINGQIRVGFYQDTVSTKSSPEKSCSPRDNPQSPYTHYQENVYNPTTTQNPSYSYYSSTNPTPPYNPEPAPNPTSFYDTSKSLTDQYQAKTMPNYINSSVTIQQHTPSPITPQQLSPNVDSYQHQTIPQQISANIDNYQQPEPAKVPEKQPIASAMFPVKKRAYSDAESLLKPRQEDLQYNRNLDQMVNQQPMQLNVINRETPKYSSPEPQIINSTQENDNLRNMNYSTGNVYNYSTNPGYPLNIPRTLEQEKKYTNMGYSAPDMGFSRNQLNYPRSETSYSRSNNVQTSNEPVSVANAQNLPTSLGMRYSDSNLMNMGYKSMAVNVSSSPQTTNMSNSGVQQQSREISEVPSGYKPPEMTIPRNPYSTPTSLDMDQSLGLRGNIPNLSHIVDRYPDERMLSGLQTPSYYGDKNLAAAQHMFSKPISTNSSGLPMFTQSNMAMPYSHSMQSTSMYNRSIELQNSSMINQDKNINIQSQPVEKKTKKRKTNKTSTSTISSIDTVSSTASQGFQSYAGLKNTSSMEPSAISLKTTSVVPGSAFNFGPTPTGLGLGSSLYGDKDAYPNFLEELRSAPNYYMAAAAAAHHRSTPENMDKPIRAAHQQSAPQASSYSFIGAPQPRPPSYPLAGPFMPPHQGPLMDASSPLYQQYLQAGMLQPGLLGPSAYPPGYHAALSMRQPYDTMSRPSWL